MIEAKNCIFCKINEGSLPSTKILELDHVLVIKDLYPKQNTHFLIIPKKHFVNMKDLSSGSNPEICLDLFKAVSALYPRLDGTQSFKIHCNNEKAADQEVFHLHWHFLSQDSFS